MMATGSLILQLHNQTKNFPDPQEKIIGNFSACLNYYLELMNNTDRILFLYMDSTKKKQLERDLKITEQLLRTQIRLTEKHFKSTYEQNEAYKSYTDNLVTCRELIDLLNANIDERRQLTARRQGTDGYPVSYLGIELGHWFAVQMVDSTDCNTKSTIEWMTRLNEKRLYWVWGSVLIKTMLDLIPEHFSRLDQAKQTIRTPDLYTGSLSWGLYYFRFFLNLSLLLKHTIAGPWMSKAEKSASTSWERFTTQWAQRKFTLLNDSLWATANILCFYRFNGPGSKGATGDLLTIALLIFDISVAVRAYKEEKTKYNKELLDYKENICALKADIDQLKAKIKHSKELLPEKQWQEEDLQLEEYNLQLHALERAYEQCKHDWRSKKKALIYEIIYTVGLMIAFSLLTMPFIPITGAAATIISVIGAVLCFAFSVIYNAAKGGLEVNKAEVRIKEAQQEIINKKGKFHGDNELQDDQKKLLFLEIKKLEAEIDYQKQVARFQTMHQIRSVLFESLSPALILVNLLFLPLGLGYAKIACVVILASISHLIINYFFKVQEIKPLTSLDSGEYATFFYREKSYRLNAPPELDKNRPRENLMCQPQPNHK